MFSDEASCASIIVECIRLHWLVGAFLCHYHRKNGLQEDIVFKITLFIIATRFFVNGTTFFVTGEVSTWSRLGCGLLHFLHVLFLCNSLRDDFCHNKHNRALAPIRRTSFVPQTFLVGITISQVM